MYTVAGSAAGNDGDSGDGGPAISALMDYPNGLSVDQYGNLYITDLNNNRIREVTATTTATVPVTPAVTSDIVVTQPGGAQVTFYPQTSSGTCTSPQVTAGGYCVLPAFQGATLTSNTTSDTYAFVPSPGDDTYTYSWDGQLISETDTAGDILTITYDSPAPGGSTSGTSTAVECPVTASSCETITSASGRALVIGANASGLVTSVTDPMGRQWTYAYNSSSQLVSASDPMGNVTSYTYGQGSNGPLQASDLLTITQPNAQPGGPDAGKDTVNVYNSANEVTSQTDPMGYNTTFNYCVNTSVSGDCMNPATGTGLVTVTDADGNITAYTYDQGTLAAQTDWTGAVGSALTSEQDYIPDTTAGGTSGGTLLDVASFDGDGNTTTYSYNAAGSPIITNAPSPSGGTATTTDYYTSFQETSCTSTALASSSGNCRASGDGGPAQVAPSGVITPPSSAPPEGDTWTLYDTDGNELYSTTGVYSPSGSYQYSQTTYQLFKGNTVTLPGTSTAISCTYTPPTMSLPCATINAIGVVTQLEYDTAGDLELSSTPDGNSGGELATTTFTYDGDGEQLTEVAPDGNVSGGNAGNYTTTTAYNADGQTTSQTEGNGSGYTDTPRVTSYTYDGDGNQATVTDARGYVTTTSYNADDQATLVTNPDNDVSLTCYDGDGNVVQTVPPVGVAVGSLTAASCPAAYPAGYSDRLASDATVSTFNAMGQMTQQTTPAPAGQTSPAYETTTYTYDGDGNLLTTTAPPATNGGSSQVTVDTYNSDDELAAETTGYGTSAVSTVSYCYDPDGDKTSVVYADGNTGLTYANGTVSGLASCSASSPWTVTAAPQTSYQTTYSYDSAGELVSTVAPANSTSQTPTTTNTYNAAGNMLTSTDPDGVTTTMTYGTNGQIIGITYSGGTAHAVSYGYDANGQMTYMTDATGASSFGFDSFGELISAENGAGQTVSYGYNADGQVSGVTYPLGSGATWATSDTVNYGYDHADQLTSVTDFNGQQITIGNTADGLPNSAGLGASGDTITTAYDAADDPSAITLKNSSSTLQSFAYADAPAGTILSETDTPSSPNSPAAYAYDAKGRVISDTPGSGAPKDYGFDASGNLTTLPTGATGAYNDSGELTSSVLSGTTTTYTYNADGEQLGSAQGSTTESAGTWNGAQELATFDNAAADMTATTYNGEGLRAADTVGGTSQDFVWDGDNLIMDGTNAYIYAGGQAPAEQVNLTNGAITYLVTDSLGSVRGTVSSTGTLTGTTSYDAWGNPATAGGLTATTPFGYAGGYTDRTGLMYLLYRYYQPATGQFMSVDPDLSQTLQPYAYTDGDPVIDTDPTGLESVLGDHDTCKDVSNGQLKAKICAEVNVSTAFWCPFESCQSEPQTVAKVTSKHGSIAEIGVRKMGLEVCGNHGPPPGHPDHCHQNNEVQGKTTDQCTGSNASSGSSGSQCYVNGGWYTSVHVNWEDAWTVGAWIKWKGGQLSKPVSVHETPLCRNGNGGKYVCDPNW
jgi:RHS repeat-associated protein